MFSCDEGMEGIALTMEGPEDPVSNWVLDTLQGAPDNWKHLDEPEEITDLKWIGKRDGQEANGVLIQTTQRRLAFGSFEQERQMTAEEQAEHAAAVTGLASSLAKQGAKITKTSAAKTTTKDVKFFWETKDTSLNQYEDKLKPPPGEGGEFPQEWAFRMMDAATFLYHARKRAGFGD